MSLSPNTFQPDPRNNELRALTTCIQCSIIAFCVAALCVDLIFIPVVRGEGGTNTSISL